VSAVTRITPSCEQVLDTHPSGRRAQHHITADVGRQVQLFLEAGEAERSRVEDDLPLEGAELRRHPMLCALAEVADVVEARVIVRVPHLGKEGVTERDVEAGGVDVAVLPSLHNASIQQFRDLRVAKDAGIHQDTAFSLATKPANSPTGMSAILAAPGYWAMIAFTFSGPKRPAVATAIFWTSAGV